jgi:hypothetical protein
MEWGKMLVKGLVAVLLLKGNNISCINVLNIHQTSPVILITDLQTSLAEAGRKWH